MKVLIGIMMIAACALSAAAQQAGPAKVLAEVASGAQAIKGQPFSADTVSESVQTLSDGNRIVQNSTGKIYRNSEGRIRREMTGGNGGNAGFGGSTFLFNYGPGVSIAEPAGGHRVLLNERDKTATTITVVPEGEVKVATRAGKGEGAGDGIGAGLTFRVKDGDPLTPEQQKAVELLKQRSAEVTRAGAELAATGSAMTHGFATTANGDNWFVGGLGDSKWETKTDDLGTQNIEGVICEGTRHVTTIPTGSIGNERPIEITYERWYSKDLGMVVSSKHSDPRFGEQTYTLKNIVRAEPDPSLFTVPREFKFMNEPGASWKVRRPEAERELVRAKAAAAATAPAAPKQP
jgi:hypothetical protein